MKKLCLARNMMLLNMMMHTNHVYQWCDLRRYINGVIVKAYDAALRHISVNGKDGDR